MVFILETVLLSLTILVNSLIGKAYLFYCFGNSLIYQLHFRRLQPKGNRLISLLNLVESKKFFLFFFFLFPDFSI